MEVRLVWKGTEGEHHVFILHQWKPSWMMGDVHALFLYFPVGETSNISGAERH